MTTDDTPVTGRFDYQGINHVSWWFDQYEEPSATEARAALAATGASWASVLLTWYMDECSANLIEPDSQKTPREEGVVAAIRHFHQLGLQVMLKPHVDVKSTACWRGTIRPASNDLWFASYRAYMTEMARLAEAERVEMLCIGTELATMSGAQHRARWVDVIREVRAVYHGSLTYAANSSNAADEFTSVSFWDLLDLAGLDMYLPLTSQNEPTREQLVAAWTRNADGIDMLSAVRNWQQSHGKPVIFTEIGYRSVDGANRAPWDWNRTGAFDPSEQADCYHAAFTAWLPERSWMKGLFWWSWDTGAPVPQNTDYSPRGKPAEALLRERFTSS